jgi:adenylate cyclase
MAVSDANEVLNTLCEGPIIEKTRYYVPSGEHILEVDVFGGDNEGLIVAEIELQSEEQDFVRPLWLGVEVSHDPRYYNVSLVKFPYKLW